MQYIAQIGNLLKKIYRNYSHELVQILQSKGYTDLRPSFLEILIFIAENEGPSIKMIGHNCGLKKQTMTSHLNELVKRNYIVKQPGSNDRREQKIFLTEYGQTFKFALMEAIADVEKKYKDSLGEVELHRIQNTLEGLYNKQIELDHNSTSS
ncbi:MAG: MarR family winged helix-turn-helix transcriptional regulator [Bacteriovoracia bacterium]